MLRITTTHLAEFDRLYTKGEYYRYSVTHADTGRTHIFRNLHTKTTRDGLAYLYGVFAELLKRGESTELSRHWVEVTRETYDADPKRWERFENEGRRSVTR